MRTTILAQTEPVRVRNRECFTAGQLVRLTARKRRRPGQPFGSNAESLGRGIGRRCTKRTERSSALERLSLRVRRTRSESVRSKPTTEGVGVGAGTAEAEAANIWKKMWLD